MKKEEKRYFLVEYYGNKRFCTVNTIEEVSHVLHEVRNYNNRKSSKFIYGNITVDKIDGKYYIESYLYRKYTDRMPISEIDRITSKMNENEVASLYKSKSKMKNYFEPDINIAYFETKNKNLLKEGEKPIYIGVKYIPVLYNDSIKYMDEAYIKRCLLFHCETKDFDFFRDLANEFDVYHFVTDEISELRTINDKCENQNENLNSLMRAAIKFYNKFIHEYDKDESLSRDKDGNYIISRRRLRDFGFFVKNYSIRDSKINSPFKYNKPFTNYYYEDSDHQIKLKL